MIIFKQISKNDSKVCYNFSAVGLDGAISINRKSLNVTYERIEGHYSKNSKEKNRILNIAKQKIAESNFPERYIYATH